MNMVNNDFILTRLNNDLIKNVAIKHSLAKDIRIKNEEPVALDLDLILDNNGSKYDLIIIRPGDIISIPPRLETVRVAGEVTSPLNLRFDNSYTFKDCINQADFFKMQKKRGFMCNIPMVKERALRDFFSFNFIQK